jgi:hypothetical protein
MLCFALHHANDCVLVRYKEWHPDPFGRRSLSRASTKTRSAHVTCIVRNVSSNALVLLFRSLTLPSRTTPTEGEVWFEFWLSFESDANTVLLWVVRPAQPCELAPAYVFLVRLCCVFSRLANCLARDVFGCRAGKQRRLELRHGRGALPALHAWRLLALRRCWGSLAVDSWREERANSHLKIAYWRAALPAQTSSGSLFVLS